MFAEGEIGDAPALIPFSEAAAKIALRTGRRLVTFLRSFGHQFHHDRGKTARYGFLLAREAAPDGVRCDNEPIPSDPKP